MKSANHTYDTYVGPDGETQVDMYGNEHGGHRRTEYWPPDPVAPVGRWMREWIPASPPVRKEIEQFAMEEFRNDVWRRELWFEESPTPANEQWLKHAREKLAALEEWTRRVSADTAD